MQSAKAAVKDLLSRSGKHDTEVREEVAPAVQREEIERQQREEVTTAVNREVHQDHYHTTVQPITEQERLPEQHHHRMLDAQTREFEHDDSEDVRRRLADESSNFQNTTTRTEGAATSTAAPTATGQHVHHHVHETIQPVIEKHTIEPHVVHTTVPINEIHHNAAEHHATSTLPAMTLEEFQAKGGNVAGRAERSETFEGNPRIAGTGNSLQSGLDPNNNTPGLATAQAETNTASGQKPSLVNKLNPRVDADGDGKKGIMD